MFLLIYNKNTNSNIFLKIIKIIPKIFGDWIKMYYLCITIKDIILTIKLYKLWKLYLNMQLLQRLF